jgi:amidase
LDLDLSALEQARLIRTGAASSEELTRMYLARISARNERLQAFTSIFHRRAILTAKRKDAERARTRDLSLLPPFHGVPIGIKDLNGVRCAPRRLGSRAFRYLIWPIDDVSVAQIRAGGFVFLGKLATSELGAMPVTEPDIHPPTRNPWNPDVTSGGSSGGSSAAVAAGMIPIAHGSDGAGSIRIPSAFCNLFGLKPSHGRVPNPIDAGEHAMTTCGPIARYVEDAAAMLDVQSGIVSGRPTRAPRPGAPFLELARRPPRRLLIRVLTNAPGCTTDPAIVDAVQAVAHRLEDLGHTVEEGRPPDGEVAEFLPIWQKMIARAPVLRLSLLQPVTRWLFEAGQKLDEARVRALQQRLARRVLAAFGDADLWLTPTVALPPPPVGAWHMLPPAEAFAQAAQLGVFTAVFNLTGQPAASVPAGLSASGLPIGVQIAGRPLGDDVVLAVSRQLEQVAPWAENKPALW